MATDNDPGGIMYDDQYDIEHEDLAWEARCSWAAEYAPTLLDSRGEPIDTDALYAAFDAFDWHAHLAAAEDAFYAENADFYYSECPACGDPIDYCQGHGPIGDPEGWEVVRNAAL